MSNPWLAKLETLPEMDPKGRRIEWTPDMDEAILAMWDTRNKQQMARALGVSISCLYARYNKLRLADGS